MGVLLMKEYTNEKLIQTIKNNRIILTTDLRNDEASSLFGRLVIIKETEELVKMALALGIKSPEINQTLSILGINTIET